MRYGRMHHQTAGYESGAVLYVAHTEETAPHQMTPQERNAGMIGAGATALVLAVATFLTGEWGYWILTVVAIPMAGVGLLNDPNK